VVKRVSRGGGGGAHVGKERRGEQYNTLPKREKFSTRKKNEYAGKKKKSVSWEIRKKDQV